MGSKRQHRQQKKNEKRKKARSAARRERGSRFVAAPGASVKGAESWPVGECYLSAHWPEQGALVHAVFVRQHSDGRAVAAFFEVDLAERGITEAATHGPHSAGQIQTLLADRYQEPMLVVPAELIVKVVHTGATLSEPTSSFQEVSALLGDTPESDEVLYTGPAPEEKPKKKSLFGWLFSFLEPNV